jgi:hypothetical protein
LKAGDVIAADNFDRLRDGVKIAARDPSANANSEAGR